LYLNPIAVSEWHTVYLLSVEWISAKLRTLWPLFAGKPAFLQARVILTINPLVLFFL
jgi:hypothetical protein